MKTKEIKLEELYLIEREVGNTASLFVLFKKRRRMSLCQKESS